MRKKLSTYARENDVTYRTALNRFKAGKIPNAFMDSDGHILIETDPAKLAKQNRAAIYTRVSRRASFNDFQWNYVKTRT